jgi:hypothetical protein
MRYQDGKNFYLALCSLLIVMLVIEILLNLIFFVWHLFGVGIELLGGVVYSYLNSFLNIYVTFLSNSISLSRKLDPLWELVSYSGRNFDPMEVIDGFHNILLGVDGWMVEFLPTEMLVCRDMRSYDNHNLELKWTWWRCMV